MGAALVVGGGVAGILAALELRRAGERVLLIERAPELGGLLRSTSFPDGTRFDFGTHLVAETGDADIDARMLGGLRREASEWQEHRVVRAGNHFAGRLNAESPCLDVRGLPGIDALLAAPASAPGAATLQEQLDALYGPALAAAAFAPAVAKLFGRPAAELAPDAHLLFLLPRVIALDPAKVRALKADPRLDGKLAFHSYREPPPTTSSWYPRAGGIGRWIELLEAELRASGVEVLTGESVAAIGDGGRRVRLASGRSEDCSLLAWSTPLFECLRTAGVKAPSAAPALQQTVLHHLVFDRPFATDLHYAACYDPAFSPFRVTLYPSLRGEGGQEAPYNCTVETLTAPGAAPASPSAVAAELAAMGFVPSSARLLDSRVETVPGGFPVATPAFRAACAAQLEAACAALPGAVFFGKARGSAFFMPDVLRETRRELAARLGAAR